MMYGIQRRHLYLVPPQGDDLDYMFESFDDEEVWEMFGFDGPAQKHMRAKHAAGNVVVAIARLVEGKRRIGFGICFPPPVFLKQWEYGFVIRDRKDRDGFSAMAAADAIAHYLFDHLRLEEAMWRARADNRPSNVVARRMGYRPFGVWRAPVHRFNFYRITPEIWAKRLAKLIEGEEKHPSGLGAPFLTLFDPPFDPEPLTSSSEPTGEAPPPASDS